MTRARGGPFTLDPLLDHKPAEHSLKEFRAVLGVSGTQWAAYQAHGLAWRTADRLAHKAGRHPVEIWPNWYTQALHDAPRCDECGAETDPLVTHGPGEICARCCPECAADHEPPHPRHAQADQ
jgi:hypothetical protein